MKPSGKWRRRIALAAALAFVTAAPGSAQSSGTCQFTLAALLGMGIELRQAKSAHRACTRAGRTTCTAEEGRMRELEQQMMLLRNYFDRYCTR